MARSNDSLLYPDLVVDGSGNGYLDFSLSGPSDYPSTGYVAVTGGQPSGPIHLAAAGTAPEDDFTCYPPFGTEASGCRWGDYSGGAVWDGRIYMMAEYVPPTPRDTEDKLGNLRLECPNAVTPSNPEQEQPAEVVACDYRRPHPLLRRIWIGTMGWPTALTPAPYGGLPGQADAG